MKKPRDLESFDKKDLVTLIRRRLFANQITIQELIYIERERKSEEIEAQMKAIEDEMATFSALDNWPRYVELSDKWDRLSKLWDRIYDEYRR